MIESVNKILKYNYIFRKEYAQFDVLYHDLETIQNDYNNRPHYAHYGLTPMEVCTGMLPDKTRFTSAIHQAARNRSIINLATICNKCEPLSANLS